MNNRLKSRAWDKETKTMHYTDFVITSTGYVAKIETEGNTCYFDQTDLNYDASLIVMQCTGLKDSTGTLIYEEDIILNTWYTDEESSSKRVDDVYKAVFCDDSLMFKFISVKDKDEWLGWEDLCCEGNLTVLGNIYGHPHLLEEQK